jgi:hypothetical protein
MFNYYSYEKKAQENAAERKDAFSDHQRAERRAQYKKLCGKSHNYRVENFMMRMLDDPIVISQEQQPYEKGLRQHSGTKKLLGQPTMHYRYDNLDTIMNKRGQLMTELDAERSMGHYGSAPILGPNFQTPHHVKFSTNTSGQSSPSQKNLILYPQVLPPLPPSGQFFMPVESTSNIFGKKPRPYTIKQMRQDEVLPYGWTGSQNRVPTKFSSQIPNSDN